MWCISDSVFKSKSFGRAALMVTLGLSGIFYAGCSSSSPVVAAPYVLKNAFSGLTFEQPVGLEFAPDGTGRLWVVEQKGTIRVFENSPKVQEAALFLNLRDRVFSGHSEEGLLGLAFHPRFKDNGFFYVNYTANNPRRTVIARFQTKDATRQEGDPHSEQILLEIPQPYGNHKGGKLAFGPDGYLYIAMGDGGSGGDPHGHGQNRSSLLGKILRIDVDHPASEKNYGIPKDNPFAGNTQGFKEEIFAYGLRNPWRFSFDTKTGWLWASDVGQDKPYEEVDIIEKGKNYGWNIMEGKHCYNPPKNCVRDGLTLPIWEYTADMGRSVTGGYVYRGQNLPGLQGSYIYGDFVSGRVWRLLYDGTNAPINELIFHNSNLYPASFGVDAQGELYVCSFDGNIYQLVASPR